jgi:hypothetical protein
LVSTGGVVVLVAVVLVMWYSGGLVSTGDVVALVVGEGSGAGDVVAGEGGGAGTGSRGRWWCW